MIATLKRREFITLLGGAAAWPVAALVQGSAMPVVGSGQVRRRSRGRTLVISHSGSAEGLTWVQTRDSPARGGKRQSDQ